MKKKITFTIHVSINNEYHRWDDLAETEKEAISIELNDRAMKSIGYRQVDKTA
jgi:hypothetical protein